MNIHRIVAAILLFAGLTTPHATRAAESYDNCAGFIDSVPTTIDTQGVWCLRHDLSTAITSGSAITIAANNVTIDCNDFKIGGLAAGINSAAKGIYAIDHLNATIRNCTIRGFHYGISLTGSASSSGGHLVEHNRLDNNNFVGIFVYGDGSLIRDNRVLDTGGSTSSFPSGIRTGYQVDVVGNTISGVTSDGASAGSNTFAISTNYGTSNIMDNRISGLVPGSSGGVYAIYHSNAHQIILTGNHLFGDGSGSGLYCNNSTDFRAKDNVVIGFAYGILGCGDGGGNDVSP
jgi:parallel beta-helix repeat protein